MPGSPVTLVEPLRSRPRGADTTAARRGSALPADLLRQTPRRLGILALVTVAVCVINLSVAHYLSPRMPAEWPLGGRGDVMTGVAVALSLALYAYTRRTRADPSRVIEVGLAYEIAICAVIAVLGHYFYIFYGAGGVGPQLSWVCPLLIVFPAIVPSTPGRTLAAGLVGASMDPLAMAAAMVAGRFDAPGSFIFWMHFPDYLCAGLGVVIAHVITGLGREVRDARDLGSYRLGRLLGRGGMGEVYVAHHRMLARSAAIKLIRPERLASDGGEEVSQIVRRFRREAEAAASLRSPHTIELYDFGVASDGTLYYVMELLDGLDLEALVTRFGPLPPARAVYLLEQACESLAEAHERGLVHRDVKPANIHVSRMGDYFDFVKVLDFGLVKVDARGPASESRLTAPDVIRGTPAYLAPEAALGEGVDHRADIYGLGCVAYWMLTGRLVFAGDSPLQVLARHIQTPPEPPSRYSAHPIPAELEEVVLACLAKSPADRPTSVRELGDRLGHCTADARWTREDARRWWQTNLEPDTRHSDLGSPV